MFEVLLVVIGVLVLLGLLLVGRSRRGGSDPSTSVDAFHRALSAMEPRDAGAGRDSRDGAADPAPAGSDDASAAGDGETAQQPDSPR